VTEDVVMRMAKKQGPYFGAARVLYQRWMPEPAPPSKSVRP
jgi:hypothetical protein